MPEIREVDPKELRLPPARNQGADPGKLSLQISRYGRSIDGMPRPWVYEAADGFLLLYDGVTRATRIAKLLPGTLIKVEVIGWLPITGAAMPSIGDKAPMTNAIRGDALEALTELSKLAPEIRLGQLFAHLDFLGDAHLGRRLADLDDDELLTVMRRHCDELSARVPCPVASTN